MSCIICMDDIENILTEDVNEEKDNLKNNLIKKDNKKSLLIVCETCNCTVCNSCMIQYVNEFKNTQCPTCRLTIDITPFLDTSSSNEEYSTQECCRLKLLKIPIFIIIYVGICYLIGEEILKNQLHINRSTHNSFIFINFFVGMIIVNFSYIICCRCSCEERRTIVIN